MPSSIIGDQYYSISSMGMALLYEGRISSGLGDIVVDLASAPIPPGQYALEIDTKAGDIDIYLPHYVQFTLGGNTILGDRNIHEGLDWWKNMVKSFQDMLSLPNEIPDHAVAPVSQEYPVIIHFSISTGAGDVNIYRL